MGADAAQSIVGSDASIDAADAGNLTPVVIDCPTQAGPNPRPGDCEQVGSYCTVRDACGTCVYVDNCDYFETGPQWEYADPLQNTGRAGCPAELPTIGSACSPDQEPPPCEYCDGFVPVLAACIEGAWRSVTYDYCSF